MTLPEALALLRNAGIPDWFMSPTAVSAPASVSASPETVPGGLFTTASGDESPRFGTMWMRTPRAAPSCATLMR